MRLLTFDYGSIAEIAGSILRVPLMRDLIKNYKREDDGRQDSSNPGEAAQLTEKAWYRRDAETLKSRVALIGLSSRMARSPRWAT